MLATRTLTLTEIDRYHDDGYVSLGRVLDDDDIAELTEEERRFRPALGYGSTTLLVVVQLCDVSEPIRRVCTRGRHIPMVAQLLGPDLCLTHTQLLTKLPDQPGTSAAIAFHQDNGYGRLDPMTDVTVWIAVTEAVQANGGLRIVPGSHRHGLAEHGRDDGNRALRRASGGEGAVAVDLGPGEAVAFSGLTMHGSGPNDTATARVGFYARYCEPDVRMLSEGGRSVLDDPHSWMVAGHARYGGEGVATGDGPPN
jgi:ectoine hydroxylase-related dioxygenase (phytanoyl-CoA dioxygenase family)